MDISSQILSEITIHSKYARYLPDKQRRETWEELVTRNKDMQLRKFPKLAAEIENAYCYVIDKKVLPSMRGLQFGGKPIEINPTRSFNCSYVAVDDWTVFSEAMFLLLCGTGVGYSVQFQHVNKLPEIRRATRTKRFLIGDSIEGWSDAIKVLTKSYFLGAPRPEFDFSDIRPKGALLKTAGGKAPGPEPLKDCLHYIQRTLDRIPIGDKLRPIDAHDIMCFIADAVLAGGIRRSAMISLFSVDDEEMLTCKYGNWQENESQRARANNSAVLLRHRVKKRDFLDLWKKIELSNSGEPGFVFSNDASWGMNPCAEVALRNASFCNLCEINVSNITSQEDIDNRVIAAAFIGTLQASYTDFHYLRDIWQKTTDKDALLGLGMTGIATGSIMKYDLGKLAESALQENSRVAKLIGIKESARTTLVKPSGTTSLVLGCSSGIHGWHDEFYLRRMRFGKNEAIFQYMQRYYPSLVEDDFFRPNTNGVIVLPMRAPEGAILRSEPPIELLERVKHFNINWIQPGHRTGHNTHNSSATISLKEDEWKNVGDWMWTNRESYNCLSVLPYDGGAYVQAPHASISEGEYNKRIKKLENLNVSDIQEHEDFTQQKEQVACAGGACEI